MNGALLDFYVSLHAENAMLGLIGRSKECRQGWAALLGPISSIFMQLSGEIDKIIAFHEWALLCYKMLIHTHKHTNTHTHTRLLIHFDLGTLM